MNYWEESVMKPYISWTNITNGPISGHLSPKWLLCRVFGNFHIAARSMHVHTKGAGRDYETWRTVGAAGKNYLIIRLKAASDGHVLLTDTVGDISRGYEVIIGGWDNTECAVRHPPGGEVVFTTSTPGIVSGEEFRTFWVSFSDGLIEMGTGFDVGANRIITWVDENSPITVTYISFSTSVNVPADWEINQYEGMTHSVAS